MNTKLKAKLLDWLKLAGCVALGFPVLIYFLQERLIFFPQPLAQDPLRANPGTAMEEVNLITSDQVRLHGWLARPGATQAPAPILIYFGGNAEEVTSAASSVPATYGQRAVLLVNYRGYGASGGAPGQAALVSDAQALFDWTARRADLDTTRVVFHGRSLGGGVAVQLAALRPARCVVLTSPFASARELARELYPWLPVGLLLRHPFDSLALAPALRMPLLVLVGDADSLVAPRHSERLARAWGGPVERRNLARVGHNDVHLHPDYDRSIREFLERCA